MEMNRRSLMGGLLSALGLAAAPGAALAKEGADGAPAAHEHYWVDTPYVLVYGDVVVRRGPSLRVCRTCGEMRVDVGQHRDAMIQRAYDDAHAAQSKRRDAAGFAYGPGQEPSKEGLSL